MKLFDFLKKEFEFTDNSVLVFNNNRIIYCNKSALNLYECGFNDIKGKTLIDLSPRYQENGELSSVLLKQFWMKFRTGISRQFKWVGTKYINADFIYMQISLDHIEFDNNKYILGIITNLSQQDNQLISSKNVISNPYTGLAIFKEKSLELLECNDHFINILGFKNKREALKKAQDHLQVSCDFLNDIISSILKKSGKLENVELLTNKVNGENIWIRKSIYQHRHKHLLECVITDITKQKNAESLLQESKIQNKILIQNIPSIFWIMEPTGYFKFISDRLEHVLGYNNKNIERIKETWKNKIHSDDLDNLLDKISCAFVRKQKIDIDFRVLTANGTWIWLNSVAEISEDRKCSQLLYGLSTDISKKKRFEDKLVFAMMNAEERERTRLSQDLHDGVSPILAATKLYTQSLTQINTSENQKELLGKIEKTLDEAMQSLSEISARISPHILQNLGLSAALQSFMSSISSRSNIEHTISSNINENLNKNIETLVYRVCVELIFNTIKYANANKIRIRIIEKNNNLLIEFKHDGVGFCIREVLKKSKGMGLRNVYNRINAVDGSVNFISENKQGLKVIINIPL